MRLIYYILTVLIVGCPAYGGVIHDEDGSLQYFTERLGKFIGKRCIKNTNLEQLNVAMGKLMDALNCLDKVMPKHNDEDLQIEENCFGAIQEVLECIKKFMDAVQPCLEVPEENYATEFVMESMENYLKFFCTHSKMVTVKELIESNMGKCISRFIKHGRTNPSNICFISVKLSDHMNNTPLTKTELCDDLDKVYSCYENQYKEYCRDSPKAWEFQGGLINAARSPCFNSTE